MINEAICNELLKVVSCGFIVGFSAMTTIELLSYGINWALALFNTK